MNLYAGCPVAPRIWFTVFCLFLLSCCLYADRVGFAVVFSEVHRQRIHFTGAGSATEKGAVLGAFFYGYGIFQIPVGLLVPRLGSSSLILVSCVLWSCGSWATAAELKIDFRQISGSAIMSDEKKTFGFGSPERFFGFSAPLIFLRFCAGAVQGAIIPCMHIILATTITDPAHKAIAVSLSMSGMYFGSALAMGTLPVVLKSYSAQDTFQFISWLPLGWLTLSILGSLLLKLRLSADPRGCASDCANNRTDCYEAADVCAHDAESTHEEMEESDLINVVEVGGAVADDLGEDEEEIRHKQDPGMTDSVDQVIDNNQVGSLSSKFSPSAGRQKSDRMDRIRKPSQLSHTTSCIYYNYGRILRCLALWVICMNSFAFHYALYAIMNWLPSYIDDFCHAAASTNPGDGYPISEMYRGIPFLVMFTFVNKLLRRAVV